MSLQTTAVDTQPTRVGVNNLIKYGFLTVFVAVVTNALIRVIALSVSTVPADFWPLGWGAVIYPNMVPGAAKYFGAMILGSIIVLITGFVPRSEL